MTDQRIEGVATELQGKTQNGLGRLTGDSKLQVEGKLNEVKGKALDAYGRVIDGLDGMVDKAPADLRDPARKGLDFARRKPLLTTGILAGAAVLLSSLGRRREGKPATQTKKARAFLPGPFFWSLIEVRPFLRPLPSPPRPWSG